MRRRAFTVVELLVMISIIVILVSLLLPAISGVRQSSKELLCMSRMRNSATAITMYTDDYRGVMPFAGHQARVITNPADETIRVGGEHGLYLGHWVDLMPEYWVGDLWTESMMCPDQPEYDPEAPDWTSATVSIDGFRRQPWYDLSAAFHLSSKSLARDAPLKNTKTQAQKLSSVAYPSSKAMLYEFLGFCLPKSQQALFWMDAAQTQHYATSVAAVDGSVFRYARRNAYEPAYGVGIEYTMNGVLGRDIDRSYIGADAFHLMNSPDTWIGTE